MPDDFDRELDRIENMTLEELEAECRSQGEDPEEVALRTKAILLLALAQWEWEQTVSETTALAWRAGARRWRRGPWRDRV